MSGLVNHTKSIISVIKAQADSNSDGFQKQSCVGFVGHACRLCTEFPVFLQTVGFQTGRYENI